MTLTIDQARERYTVESYGERKFVVLYFAPFDTASEQISSHWSRSAAHAAINKLARADALSARTELAPRQYGALEQ